MNESFQIRRSSKAAYKPETVHFEIDHVSRERQRVFVVIDLSDSAEGITAQLESFAHLWRLLPSQWTVSLCALSPSLQLPGGEVTTSAADVGKALEENFRSSSPTLSKALQRMAARGSFLGLTLRAIEARRTEEASAVVGKATPTVIFVVTDGELLDLEPVHPSADAKVIGVLVDTRNKRTARWGAVIPGSACFKVSDPSLAKHIKGIVSPEARKCTITLSLHEEEPSEVYQWDFATRGRYELDVPSSNLPDEAFIECRSESGAVCKWAVRSLLQGETDELLSGVARAGPATVSSGALHEIRDESLINALREHAVETQREQCSWRSDIVQLLATHLAALSGEPTAQSVRLHALLAVFCQRETEDRGNISEDASLGPSRLLIGLLYEDRSKSIYVPRAVATLSDPGFSAKDDVHILWDNNERRMTVLTGNRPPRLLELNECETLDYFLDQFGQECTAFYSGRIEWPA